eukprot:8296123-Pyramimonas_sp.AAC.1
MASDLDLRSAVGRRAATLGLFKAIRAKQKSAISASRRERGLLWGGRRVECSVSEGVAFVCEALLIDPSRPPLDPGGFAHT